jgi:triosephosphate isomerase
MENSMRTPVIAGNWKMHKNMAEARSLARSIRAGAGEADHCRVILAPPYTALGAVAEELSGSPLILAAQNVHWEKQGAYTGEISIPMLEDIGCAAVIVGHSERRQYFSETDETVNKRIRALSESQLETILCIGETLEQREAGDYETVVSQQLAGGLAGLTAQNLKRIMLAYEPVWAIGTGRTASPEIAQEVHQSIRAWLAREFGRISETVPILYGGSVKPGNISALMSQPDIDGALVGGACLEAESFLGIIHYNT